MLKGTVNEVPNILLLQLFDTSLHTLQLICTRQQANSLFAIRHTFVLKISCYSCKASELVQQPYLSSCARGKNKP
uniref:Uncharacterized protein n=1 Tax=Arundo donax TaxID=35708 RepID=A0A0A8YYP4_ARUDO